LRPVGDRRCATAPDNGMAHHTARLMTIEEAARW
jgi:hypothetical protein